MQLGLLDHLSQLFTRDTEFAQLPDMISMSSRSSAPMLISAGSATFFLR